MASRSRNGVRWLAGAILSGALAGPWLVPAPPVRTAAAEEVAALRDQLLNGLQARRPEDRAFLERVAVMVDQGRLPVELVKSTFQWARERKKPYPYPYFERALRIRAAEQGIAIP